MEKPTKVEVGQRWGKTGPHGYEYVITKLDSAVAGVLFKDGAIQSYPLIEITCDDYLGTSGPSSQGGAAPGFIDMRGIGGLFDAVKMLWNRWPDVHEAKCHPRTYVLHGGKGERYRVRCTDGSTFDVIADSSVAEDRLEFVMPSLAPVSAAPEGQDGGLNRKALSSPRGEAVGRATAHEHCGCVRDISDAHTFERSKRQDAERECDRLRARVAELEAALERADLRAKQYSGVARLPNMKEPEPWVESCDPDHWIPDV